MSKFKLFTEHETNRIWCPNELYQLLNRTKLKFQVEIVYVANCSVLSKNFGLYTVKKQSVTSLHSKLGYSSYASAPLEMHAGCMQPACSLHTIVCRRLQQHACSMHAGCMQPTLRFKCSRLHWNTCAHSRRRCRVQGVDALHPRVDTLHTGINALHAGRRRQENTPRMNMLIFSVFFRAYFSIFSLWQHVVMSSRCHLWRTWPAGLLCLLFTSS